MKYIFDECKLHFIQERYSIMGIILQQITVILKTNENAIMLEQKLYKNDYLRCFFRLYYLVMFLQ